MRNNLIILLMIVLLCSSVSSFWTPQSSIHLRDTYNITGAPYINATIYYGNGSQLTDLTASTSNSSTWWASVSGWVSGYFKQTGNNLDFNETKLNETIQAIDTATNTSMKTYVDGTFITQANEGNLNVNSSSYWDNLNTINTTQLEDSSGELNIKESWISSLWCKLTGCTMTGDLNISTNDAILTMYGNSSMLGGSPASGGINLIQDRPEAKAGIWWDAYDLASDTVREVAWMVAHYNSSSGGSSHSHWSVETLDNTTGTPSINTHFAISYNSSQTRADVNFPTADVKFVSNQKLYFGDTKEQASIKHNGTSGDLELKANADIKIKATQLDMDGKDIVNLDDIFGSMIDMKPTTYFRIFGNSQTDRALRFTDDGTSPVVDASGSDTIKINENLDVTNNITATYFKGAGDELTGVRLQSWDNFTGIPTATPSNGDTTHLSTADQIYDWVISLAYATTTLVNSLGNWSNDKSDYWNSSIDLDTVIATDEITELKIDFNTVCGAGNHLYVSGNNLACESDDDTTYSAGSGLGLAGTTFSHTDTSSQASSDNSGRTYIQDILLDTYGHITSIVTGTETVTNTDTQDLSYDTATNVISLVDGGNIDITEVDTSANTICSGTTTYLDGEGNCDTIDGVEDLETPTDDSLIVGTGTVFDTKTLPDCDDSSGNHINYDTTSNAFSCGTSSSVTNTNTNCSSDGSCSSIAYDSEINKTYVDAQDSAQDACSEITGCVENAITDGNTNWDNSYGFYDNITNFTGTMTDGKICIYDSSQQIINCTYTDQTGASGNPKAGDGTYLYNDSTTMYLNATYAGINLEVNGSDYWDGLGSPSDINAADITDDGTYRLQSWNNLTGIPHATPSNGDTTHFSLADEIYDWVISLAYATVTQLNSLGNWSADKSDYWNASTDLDGVIATDEITELKIDFNTACAAGNHLYVNGNNLACEADDDTTYLGGNAITLAGTTFNFDGGATPGGELGNTWASPTIDSGIHDDEYVELGDSFANSSGDATVSGAYNAIVITIGHDALDDQYYDSEADLTGLLDDNYEDEGAHFDVSTTTNITCLDTACNWYANATDSCMYWPSGGKDCSS